MESSSVRIFCSSTAIWSGEKAFPPLTELLVPKIRILIAPSPLRSEGGELMTPESKFMNEIQDKASVNSPKSWVDGHKLIFLLFIFV
jgi:hypothetical protein